MLCHPASSVPRRRCAFYGGMLFTIGACAGSSPAVCFDVSTASSSTASRSPPAVPEKPRPIYMTDGAAQVANVYSGKGFDAAYPWLVTITYFVGELPLSSSGAKQRLQPVE